MSNTLPAALAEAVAFMPAKKRNATRTPMQFTVSHHVLLALGASALLAMVPVGVAVALASDDARIAVLASAGVSIAAGTALGAWWLHRTISGPLRQALALARRLREGDLATPVPVRKVPGELGELLQALQQTRERLFRVVSRVRTGTTTVAATSSQISRDGEALAQRTQGQNASLEEIAAAMEQLTAAVRQNAETAQQADTLFTTSSQRAARGGELMRDVIQTMGSIRDSSRRIVEITGAVDAIAFQTNLLALNAAVEAARAGEQGRGFAVVAAEVRALSQRCAAAAREIKGLIGDAVHRIDAGGTLVDDAGNAMREVVDSVQQVTSLMGGIHVASREQSSGIESINAAIAKLERMTQRNAGVVEGAARTTGLLNAQAVGLMRSVEGFALGAREHGSREEAHALVQAGLAWCRQHGTQALIADVNRVGEGRFVDRDLYLMVYQIEDGVLLAHGNNPRMVGFRSAKFTDSDGRPFVAEMLRTGATRGSGWIDYKWAHPVTNATEAKTSYFERHEGVLIACGAYKQE